MELSATLDLKDTESIIAVGPVLCQPICDYRFGMRAGEADSCPLTQSSSAGLVVR